MFVQVTRKESPPNVAKAKTAVPLETTRKETLLNVSKAKTAVPLEIMRKESLQHVAMTQTMKEAMRTKASKTRGSPSMTAVSACVPLA